MFGYFAHLFFGSRLLLNDVLMLSIWGYHILSMLMMYALLYACFHRYAIVVSRRIRLLCLTHFLLSCFFLAYVLIFDLPAYLKQVNSIMAISCMLFFSYAVIRKQNENRHVGENIFSFAILTTGVIVLVVSPIMLMSVEPTEFNFSYIVTVISIASSSIILFGFAVSIIHSLVRKLRIEMNTDRLTGVKNRNYFYDVAAEILSFGDSKVNPASIIISDIDDFKSINDTYGHITGDLALVSFAECLQNNVRSVDSVIRLGGEEFLILLTSADEKLAVEIAEKIRRAVCEVELNTGGQTLTLTASFGVKQIDPNRSVDDNISFADKALYQAKKAGKNQVVVFRD